MRPWPRQWGAPPGEQHPMSKLTAGEVRAMRKRYAAGGVSQRALAAEYGVSHTTVRAVLDGTSWKHVKA